MSLHPVIEAICVRHKTICELCGIIVHKADSCVISGTNLLPPRLRINMNKFDALHGNKPAGLPRKWNIQPPESHFKYWTSHPQKPVLWFWLSCGDSITTQLIITMLIFTLHIIHLNLPLTLSQTHITFQFNPLMMMKWTIYLNYFTQITMMILWVSISKCFSVDQCYLHTQKLLQYQLCCFIKTEEKMLELQIACLIFICLSQPRSIRNWITATRNMTNKLGLFYALFLTVLLFIVAPVYYCPGQPWNTMSSSSLQFYVGV